MKRWIAAVALLAILLAFAGLYANAVWDTDFWWHIATGRHIVATGEIPSHDPFGVYDTAGPRSITILKCYWIAQVLFYLVMQKLGAAGIAALKATLLVGCLLVLHHRAARAGSHPAATYAVIALVGLTLTAFEGERPQLVSFLLCGVVFLLLDRYGEEAKAAWLVPIPTVMALWANSHGGVALGAALMVVYAGARVAERWRVWSRGATRERNVFLAVIALSLVMALASPTGWNAFLTVIELQGTEFKSRVSEYQSPYLLWRDHGIPAAYPYAVLLGLALLALVPMVRRRQLVRASLVVFLGALSTTAFRYIPFFVLVAGPYVAAELTRIALRTPPPRRLVEGIVIAAAMTAIVLGVRGRWMFQVGAPPDSYPAGAVAYLQKAGATGKVLSSFEWGGYVIWNLHPAVRPYVDGRNLDMTKFAKYTHMIWATPQGRQFFEGERFDYVLLPPGNAFTREEYPLNRLLAGDPRWRLVYHDRRGDLFSSRADAH